MEDAVAPAPISSPKLPLQKEAATVSVLLQPLSAKGGGGLFKCEPTGRVGQLIGW